MNGSLKNMEFEKEIDKFIYNHILFFIVSALVLVCIIVYLLTKLNDKGLDESEAGSIMFVSLVISAVLYFSLLAITCDYDNQAEKAIVSSERAGYVNTKYVSVKSYQVKSYLPIDKGKAQVLLNNGKVVKNVPIKKIKSISKKNKDTLTFYDINLKEKYRPTEKNRFRKKVLVLNKQRTGFSAKKV
ncbi:hypothetical protein CBF61_00510 [Lactobacillus taiwanensis]|uniref:Uncharacterized protein n=2 Tax=Lactobacillus taiwanensis TaxID=508451 RepID=A0ABX4ES96_9LACO|nr:hypothetical protein CBF53_01265 [Lactobacillus taiwanensis]OYR93604.1 hypothetical protein CBF59_01265 [Lactobacillus taiwanensis]OYR97170.1 hypothetical protein CBF58_01340 [Lactobacillus taiwanensis]OYR98072.1 hypothetical protein CBF51_00585 [Lactobacillus taiwanensis]OYS00558.1 hypothetical protein CBF68_10390 [Lactobacillus taiwanensis]